jgi:hypothetical protein
MDAKKSVALLNKGVADELQAVHQYMYWHFHLADQGFGPLAAMFRRLRSWRWTRGSWRNVFCFLKAREDGRAGGREATDPKILRADGHEAVGIYNQFALKCKNADAASAGVRALVNDRNCTSTSSTSSSTTSAAPPDYPRLIVQQAPKPPRSSACIAGLGNPARRLPLQLLAEAIVAETVARLSDAIEDRLAAERLAARGRRSQGACAHAHGAACPSSALRRWPTRWIIILVQLCRYKRA